MAMVPSVLDDASFHRFLSDHDIAVIGFIGQDGDAGLFAALSNAVPGNQSDAVFAQVPREHRALFELFGVKGTATAIFRQRVGMYLEPGLPDPDLLVRLLTGINALDMERVRSELEQERAARESLAVHRICPATRRGKLG
jgi:hypothetical protein